MKDEREELFKIFINYKEREYPNMTELQKKDLRQKFDKAYKEEPEELKKAVIDKAKEVNKNNTSKRYKGKKGQCKNRKISSKAKKAFIAIALATTIAIGGGIAISSYINNKKQVTTETNNKDTEEVKDKKIESEADKYKVDSVTSPSVLLKNFKEIYIQVHNKNNPDNILKPEDVTIREQNLDSRNWINEREINNPYKNYSKDEYEDTTGKSIYKVSIKEGNKEIPYEVCDRYGNEITYYAFPNNGIKENNSIKECSDIFSSYLVYDFQITQEGRTELTKALLNNYNKSIDEFFEKNKEMFNSIENDKQETVVSNDDGEERE